MSQTELVTTDDELRKSLGQIIDEHSWEGVQEYGIEKIVQLIIADRKKHELDARIDEHKGMVDQIAGNPMHTKVASYHYGRINALKAEREKL